MNLPLVFLCTALFAFAQTSSVDLEEKARKLTEAKNFKEASQLYKQAVQNRPKSATL